MSISIYTCLLKYNCFSWGHITPKICCYAAQNGSRILVSAYAHAFPMCVLLLWTDILYLSLWCTIARLFHETTDWRREFRSHAVEKESLNLRHYADWINISLRGNYSVTNSIGATQRFSANHKASSEQKNRSLFISYRLQMRVNSDWELMRKAMWN